MANFGILRSSMDTQIIFVENQKDYVQYNGTMEQAECDFHENTDF